MNEDNSVSPCSQCEEPSHSIEDLEYIRIWHRLQAKICNDSLRPLMYDYYQRDVRDAFDGDDTEYCDFFPAPSSRRLLKNSVVSMLSKMTFS